MQQQAHNALSCNAVSREKRVAFLGATAALALLGACFSTQDRTPFSSAPALNDRGVPKNAVPTKSHTTNVVAVETRSSK